MDEIDNGPLTNEQLARAALGGMVKFMVIKWTVIIVLTKLAKRAAKKYAS